MATVIKKFTIGTTNWTAPGRVKRVRVQASSSLSPITAASAGSTVFMLDALGNAYAFGDNSGLRLGTGDGTGVAGRSTPTMVAGSHRFVQVGPGFGLDTGGYAWGWGQNDSGQVGDGTLINRSSPSPINNGRGARFSRIESGGASTCALDLQGALWTWGSNTVGQLGHSGTLNTSFPIAALGGGVFTQATISSHLAALDVTGKIWTCGLNSSGQLGFNDITNRSIPTSLPWVITTAPFISVCAGFAHTVALDHAGQAWVWGSNTNGELGLGDTVNRSSPVKIVGGPTFVQLTGGSQMTAGLDSSGNIWSWGRNDLGQLGVGDILSRSTPTLVTGGLKFSKLLAVQNNVLALDVHNQLWAWGYNFAGVVGDGTTINRSSPTAVLSPAPFGIPSPPPILDVPVTPGVTYPVVVGIPQSSFGGVPLGTIGATQVTVIYDE